MTDADKNEAAGRGPSVIEAELVGADDAEAPPRLETAPPRARGLRPSAIRPRLVVAAAGAAILLLAAGGLWILKPRIAPPAPAAEPAADLSAAAAPSAPAREAATGPDKIANSGREEFEAEPVRGAEGPAFPPRPGAPDAAGPPAAAGDASSTEESGAPPPAAIPAPAAGPSAGPIVADAADALARLEAEAAAREAAEAAGVVAAQPQDPPSSAPTLSAAPAPSAAEAVSDDLAAVRNLLEAETARLAAELGAERARADRQAGEIAMLKAEIEAGREAAARAAVRNDPAPDDAAAVLALLALSRAIEDGRPFKAELAWFERLKGGSPAVRRLAAAAEKGAPTRAALKESFPDLARRALADDARARAKGPAGAVLAGFVRLVTIMPAKPAPGARPAAVLSRAKGRLAADDVAGALAELEGLAGAARETFKEWLADAGRHVEARAALSDLNAELLDDRAARGAP